MSLFESLKPTYEFNRMRTLDLLDRVEQLPDPIAALGWRPGPGRAHIAWQLVHTAVTEDIFASERLAQEKSGLFTELWPRFRGGSTPDDQIPTAAEIRDVLLRSRESLFETLATFTEADLDTIPEPLKERGFSIRTVHYVIGWHEGHHQGQAHLTLNLFKAAHSV